MRRLGFGIGAVLGFSLLCGVASADTSTAYLLNLDNRELGRIKGLDRKCLRLTQLSADGQRVLYLSASRPDLCALAVQDEVRLTDADGRNDRVVLRTDDAHYVITDVDWWSD